MAIAVASTREALVLAYIGLGTYLSMHTADPGTTGANEATGGGYVRKATGWVAGATDGVATGSQVTFDLAAGTYTHVGFQSAATAGTFLDKAAMTSTTLGAVGQILITPTVTVT